MKKLAVAVLALGMVASVPNLASAQEAKGGMDGGAVLSTVAGAVVGGAVGYYYFTGQAATLIGVVVGGVVGDWWYTAANDGGPAMKGGKMKMQYTESPTGPFQLINYSSRATGGLRTAAFSEAAN